MCVWGVCDVQFAYHFSHIDCLDGVWNVRRGKIVSPFLVDLFEDRRCVGRMFKKLGISLFNIYKFTAGKDESKRPSDA